MFKKIDINMPFVQVLVHMPKYEKFLQELVTTMKKLGELGEVAQSQESKTERSIDNNSVRTPSNPSNSLI